MEPAQAEVSPRPAAAAVEESSQEDGSVPEVSVEEGSPEPPPPAINRKRRAAAQKVRRVQCRFQLGSRASCWLSYVVQTSLGSPDNQTIGSLGIGSVVHSMLGYRLWYL